MGNDMTSARKLSEPVSTGASTDGREPTRSLRHQVWNYVSRYTVAITVESRGGVAKGGREKHMERHVCR